jgi:hypothetical protein
MSLFSIYIHVYTIFAPFYSLFPTSSPPLPLLTTSPPSHRTCSTLWFYDFCIRKKNDIFMIATQEVRLCIVDQFGSSLLFFFFLP